MNCYPTGKINFFPGVSSVGEALTCVICELFLTGIFLIALFWLKFYLRGESTASVVIGRFFGFLAGTAMAVLHAYVFNQFFSLDDTGFSICLIVFMLINLALTSTVVYPPIQRSKWED